MAKKRTRAELKPTKIASTRSKYDLEERYDDSEDDFYAERDEVFLDEGLAANQRRRLLEQEQDIEFSDEDIYAEKEFDYGNEDKQSLQSFSEAGHYDDQSDEHWGTAKADYYNADIIETEADALDEEREAKRLQQKQLDSITDADFGFDRLAWAQPAAQKSLGLVVEKLPEPKIPAGANASELASMIRNRYPEFDLLARDFVELQELWVQFRGDAGILSANDTDVEIKLHAITSYLGAIAMYFAVIASKINSSADASEITALAPGELREHAIIASLVQSRNLWDVVKDMKWQVATLHPDEQSILDPTNSTNPAVQSSTRDERKNNKRKKKLPLQPPDSVQSDERDGLDKSEMSKLVNRASKPKPMDFDSLLAQSTVTQDEDNSDFGDESPLTEQQFAEKAKKKKSLRFYTSQIAQKANKRDLASREAGGDDDVPHKERLRDKQERLMREAEKRGQQRATLDEALDGESEADTDNLEGDEYYQSVVARAKQRKVEKRAKADAYGKSARKGAEVYEDEQVGADGKRRITYAIEKNKGLAPKRKKDVRNPRVKKRKKFDEKLKKLGSVRQVYKGGEGRGGYGGELTGIKTNVVKSVKL